MRVLWLTSHILPDHTRTLGIDVPPIGGWIAALADALCKSEQVELGIATNVPEYQWSQKKIKNKVFFTIPTPLGSINYRTLPGALIKDYQRAVEEFKPDIIHIHGTEYFHGLITGRKIIKCPTVISIQGLIDVCKKYYFGEIKFCELVKSRTLRDWMRLDGLIEQKIKWFQRAKWEREIFATNQAFIGRTQWDLAHTRRLNPAARYYHCDELLRYPFYEAKWKLDNINRHSIYASSAQYPIKGFHTLIKAVALLHREFPNIAVRAPLAYFYHTAKGVERLWKNLRSGGYAKYLTDLIENEGVGEHIVSLGSIKAEDVASELEKAHIFVLPSFIENSPNSLAEAMLVGTPSIVSFVGGVPNMVNNRETALCFSPGDEAVLAEQIRQLFLDDDLAEKLSAEARQTAILRHSKQNIAGKVLEIYRSEISHYAS